MIEDYIDEKCPVKYSNGSRITRYDVMNFHLVLDAIDEKNKSESAKNNLSINTENKLFIDTELIKKNQKIKI